MAGRFAHGQDWRKAHVGALHDLAPFLARPGLEHVRELLLKLGPRLAIHLLIEIVARKSGQLPQQRVELRFDRADRNEVAARAFVDAVKMCAAVEEIALARLTPS